MLRKFGPTLVTSLLAFGVLVPDWSSNVTMAAKRTDVSPCARIHQKAVGASQTVVVDRDGAFTSFTSFPFCFVHTLYRAGGPLASSG